MRRPTRTLMVLGAVCLAAGLAGCHWHHPTAEEHAAHVDEVVTDKLELNPAQAAKFKEVTDVGLVIAKEFKGQKNADLAFLTQQMTANDLDKAKLLAIYQNHRAVLDREMPKMIDKLAAFHAALTPAQKADLAERWQKVASHMKDD